MSSFSPLAQKSMPGRQPQPGQKNSHQHLAIHNTAQSPPAGTKALQNYTVTSYPVGDHEGYTDDYSRQSFDEHSSQNDNLQPDGRISNSTLDTNSQYLSNNYLTPDYGSENLFSEQSNFTSPNLDDFIWQESFNTSQNYDDFNDGTLVNSIFTDINHHDDLQGIVPKDITPTTLEPHPTMPRISSTTTATTTTEHVPRMTAVGRHVPGTDQGATGVMRADNNKRARASDDDEGTRDDELLNPASLERPSSAIGHTARSIMRPTVTVSTYNRGDSPARTALPMARSLSKRSQSSRLSDRGESNVEDGDVPVEVQSLTSRLMPPSHYDNLAWTEDDQDEGREDRSGVVPDQRTTDEIPSLKDMKNQRELDDTRVGVENWLATSNPGSPTGSDFGGNPLRGGIRRSRSTGARTKPLGGTQFSDKHILGPGVLLDVDSASDYSDDDDSNILTEEGIETMPESPPAQVDPLAHEQDDTFPPNDRSIAPEEQEPLSRQFYRRPPFQDVATYPGPIETREQPPTANHAMMQYDQQIARFENASRVGTWGTRRRLSDSEVASIIDGTKVRNLSISSKARDRGNSIINRARTVLRRSSSNVKKSKDHLPKQSTPPNEPAKMTMFDNNLDYTVTSPIQQIQRQFSWGKTKSPPPQNKNTSTGGAILAMTSQLTAVGSRTPGGNTESLERPGPKSPFLNALKRSRSKSDLPKASKTTGGLSDLFNKYGGPPVTTLGTSPMPVQDELSVPNHTSNAATGSNDDMDDDDEDEIPQKMPLPVQHHNIIPNLDGFRTHAKQLNPRSPQYLTERIAQDQLRRYKKLVKNKIDHTRGVQLRQSCPSGEFCVDLGGKPKILPPRTSIKDSSVNYAQFKIGAGGDSDGDEAAFIDGGVVTPALFPQGIPLPPTTHLPAEFECPLCFQVKKFQKPSDWTKHVHEDVQPFSCTFPNCPEPKSFKRKADWVRHENERHRHLEWWRCSIQECNHICYRRDNFVQHLVREHKMTEPKAKGQKPTGNRTRPAARTALGQEANEFRYLVEHCRHDTHDLPKNELCKFCGNSCSSWKKLSVHVGKHMEQIAMPVLELAAKRTITADTIISPIDAPNQRIVHASMLDTNGLNGNNMDALSPYSAGGVSVYQASSASHSPAPAHSVHAHSNSTGQIYYDQSMIQNGLQPMNGNLQQYNTNAVNQNFVIPSYQMANGPSYMDMASQANAYTQQPVTQNVPATFHPRQAPRSQAMATAYGGLNVDTMQGSMYSNDQYYPNSAPGTDFVRGFGNGTHHNDGLHSPHHGQVGLMHSPVDGIQQNGNEYMFSRQNGGQTGSYY